MRIAESDDGAKVSGEFSVTSTAVRSALHADLKSCGKSRDQVAFELTGLMGRAVTIEQIDAFVAPSKPHRFPAEWIPAWVKVTGSRRMLDLLCASLGLSVATDEDREFAEYGRLRVRETKLAERLWARC